MFGGALDKVTGFLDQRLVLTSLLPSVAFWSAVLALVGSQVGWTRAQHWWAHLSSGTNVLVSVVAVALLVLFALLLSAHESTLIGLYEGYWGRGPVGRWLADRAAGRHRRRVESFDQKVTHLDERINALPAEIAQLDLDIAALPAGDSKLAKLTKQVADKRRQLRSMPGQAGALIEFWYGNYPKEPEKALPTRLGNILKAAEEYPAYEGRYGIDAVFFWPRLIAVVPDSTRANLSDARATFVLLLNVCTLALLLSVGVLAALVFAVIHPAVAFWASAASGAVLAYLMYRSALGPARVYGELVRATFDLYRGDLLNQLKLSEPASFAQERTLWSNLGQMMYRGDASDPDILDSARVSAAAAAPDQGDVISTARSMLERAGAAILTVLRSVAGPDNAADGATASPGATAAAPCAENARPDAAQHAPSAGDA